MSVVDSTFSAAAVQARDAYAASRPSPLADIGKGMSEKQVGKAAEDFEAFFLSQMLQPMFNTVKTDEMFGGGPGEDMWKSMMVDTYAKEIAHGGGLGIADQVKKVMIQAQEVER